MSESLLILGAGGHGRVVADAAFELGISRIAFLDDAFPDMTSSGPFAVIGRIADHAKFVSEWRSAFVAIGNNRLRLDLFRRLGEVGFRTPNVIHPRVIISRHAVLGSGVFAAAAVVVNIGASVGDAVLLNTAATIDHDCAIGAGAHVSPGAHLAGNVTVGDCAWVGIGVSVRNGARIGHDAVVGAGAAVVSDIPDAALFAGVPARALSPNRTG